MISDSQVIATYKRLSTDELIELAGNPAHLRPEIIPLLANELRARNLDVYADELLSSSREAEPDEIEGEATLLSADQLETVQLEVQERLRGGEAIESIKADLAERGINIFNLVQQETQRQDDFFDRLTQMKQDGVSNFALQQKLVQEDKLTEEESWMLMEKLRDKGRKNMLWGAGWFLVSAGVLLFSYEDVSKYGSGIIIIPYGPLFYGLVRFIKGVIQRRS